MKLVLPFPISQKKKVIFRLLAGYFLFTKTNYEELKKSRIIVMRVQYSGETKDYILPDTIQSEIVNQSLKPSSYFIDNLACVE